MKKLLIIVLGLVAVYEGYSLVPSYYVEQKRDVIKIYDSKQLIVPKYIIKDNKVYIPNGIIPIGIMKERTINGRDETK